MVGSGSGISKQNLLIAFTQIGRIQDLGSGAFLPPGSGIWIWDGATVGSGSGIRDKTSRIHNTELQNIFFLKKYQDILSSFVFFAQYFSYQLIGQIIS
jgi:hypothetical protein